MDSNKITVIIIGLPVRGEGKLPDREPLQREKGRTKTKEGKDHYYL